ncbi:MAG TPA: ribonuclease HI [Candidatus Bathyarchaeia archaeon]|nr:ribonuclease HI [Candidatus Bathyarchaeia archaeon]
MIEVWIDGLCEPINPGGTACIGYIIKREGKVLAKTSEVVGRGEGMTNNVAEYTALVRALEKIIQLGLAEQEILVRSDSRLVVNQMKGNWEVKAPLILPLYRKAKMIATAMNIKFNWICREENTDADSLCRTAYESTR